MKKFKKAVKIILIIVTAFAFIIAGINTYIIMLGRANFTDMENISGTYDCAIVPGARVWSDGTVSYMLRDRLDYAYNLYEQGTVGKILVSGDHGRTNYDEVNAMRAYLVEKGVNIEDVFMDHAGFDTYATMYRARDIFCVESAVVCTQKYHLYPRVVYRAEAGYRYKGHSLRCVCFKRAPPL